MSTEKQTVVAAQEQATAHEPGAVKPVWQRPTITRIAMKQTLDGSGAQFADLTVYIE